MIFTFPLVRGYPSDLYDINSYTEREVPILPSFGTQGSDSHAQIDFEYSVLDENGMEMPISGLFGFEDVDYASGHYINDFIATQQNTFISGDSSIIGYKTIDNEGTYFYSAIDGNVDDARGNFYILIKNKSKIKFTYVTNFDQGFFVEFFRGVINRYRQIVTKVIGGTITPTVTGIKDGESRTITYAPNDSTKQYLKSITVDGEEIDLERYTDSYTFSDIDDSHTIEVEYADKYKVVFDAKGGTPTPETQYVKGGETAVEPVKEPTKKGYTFEGWTLDGGSSPYNFAEPVNKDIKLVAKWKPIVYKIDYVLNGGTNDPENPTTYTREDTIDFKPAPRFQGRTRRTDGGTIR